MNALSLAEDVCQTPFTTTQSPLPECQQAGPFPPHMANPPDHSQITSDPMPNPVRKPADAQPFLPGFTVAPQKPPAPISPQLAAQNAILLVDDEPAILAVMRIALEKSGFHVVLARSGLEALEKFQPAQDSIRLLITDMAMPGMNGLDLIRQIRSLQTNIAVIATTGMTTTDQMQAIRDAGVSHVLSKPCGSRQLIDLVRTILLPA